MFIKRNRRSEKGKIYEYGFLVCSINTPQGSRHKVLYTLGRFDGIDPEQDKHLAMELERMLSGQTTTTMEESQLVKDIFARLKPARGRSEPIDAEIIATDLSDLTEHLNATVGTNSEQMQLPSFGIDQYHEPEIVQIEIPGINVDFKSATPVPDWLEISTNILAYHDAREAGCVHVGHQVWKKLELTEILKKAGLTDKECQLTEVLTLNRLIEPSSEHATPDWVARTALSDILGEEVNNIDYRDLYGNLDKLHPRREAIEKQLYEREKNLFNLDESLFLYDLTSTYMEGKCEKNPAAKHGYSRDSRPDCRQQVLGLMLNKDRFPIGHEIFAGNTTDSTTVKTAIDTFESRTGIKRSATIVVDRGMSDKANLELIKARGHHYIVAAKQTERARCLAEFESEEGWQELKKQSSSINPVLLPTGVRIKRFEKDGEYFILCISDGRTLKDRAIREKHEERFLRDLKKLQSRVNEGKLKPTKKIYEAIGRIKERYPRVSRYFDIELNETSMQLLWQENAEKKGKAERVDGAYVLRTTRTDLDDAEIWRTYMLLTGVEAAFRDLKSPLSMRPIFHQLQQRTEAHIFICILAYHLLITIEHMLHAAKITKSWETVRKELSTHQTVSGTFVTKNCRVFEIRKDTFANQAQKEIYAALAIEPQVFKIPRRRWVN